MELNKVTYEKANSLILTLSPLSTLYGGIQYMSTENNVRFFYLRFELIVRMNE